MNIRYINNIGSDAKLNFDVIHFAIKYNTAFCEIEIILKSNSDTRVIM